MNENPQTPEEVGQWLRDHGGPARSEGPDANGIVIQYAADGSYLRQQAITGGATRVLEVKPAGPASPGGDGSPPATTSAPRGAGMTQQELETLLAQMGALGPGDFREEVKTEDAPNPKYNAADPENNQPTVKQSVTYRTWVKPGTNQRLTVKVNPDQSYTQVFSGADASINPARQTPNDTPDARQKAEDEREKQWNQANGGLYETHAERRVREAREKRDADADARAAADRNKPTVSIREDGNGNLVAVSVDASGNVTTKPTGIQGKPPTVTVDGTVYEHKPDGTYTPVIRSTKDDYAGEPADAPPMNLTPGQVTEGLRAYSSYLAAQVKLHRDTGGKQGVSPENATKLMEQRIKLAETAGRESSNLASQQQGLLNSQITQRGNTLSETSSRRGDANSAYNNNLSRFIPQMTMMGPGGGQLVANALTASLGANTAYVDQWGGFRESPEIQTPGFLQSVRDASMAGIQTAARGGPVLTGPVGAPPAAAAAPPSAVDVEAERQRVMGVNQAETGRLLAPEARPAFLPPPSVPPPPPAANPINGQPITVPTIPQGASMTSDPQTNFGIPTFDPAAPPALTGAQEPGMMPPVAPPAGIPGNPDYQPGLPPGSSIIQQPVNQMPVDVPYPTTPGAQSQMAPSFLTGARYGEAYDPRARAALLGIRPDILELALAG